MGRTILVVEDSPDFRVLSQRVLTHAGYQVFVASNGLEGLDYIKANGAPDLLLSDIQMPELDGLEMVQQLRHDARTSSIPVLFVSCHGECRDQALNLGRSSFLIKGSGETIPSLLREVHRLLPIGALPSVPMSYQEWLAEFRADKTQVAVFEQSPHQALHSIAGYMDQKDHVWEVAFTYTGRLVVRSGDIEADGIDIKWSEWKTLHEVEVPRSPSVP